MSEKAIMARALSLFDRVVDLSLEEQLRVLQEEGDEPALRELLLRMLEADRVEQLSTFGELGLLALAPTANRAEVPSEIPTDRYEMLGPIATGGMGEVVRVRDRKLNRSLAMKVIRSDLSQHPGIVSRFLEEAQCVAQLQHPGIVPIYDFGETRDGRMWFTMREILGQTMSTTIRTHHTLARPDRHCPVPRPPLGASHRCPRRPCRPPPPHPPAHRRRLPPAGPALGTRDRPDLGSKPRTELARLPQTLPLPPARGSPPPHPHHHNHPAPTSPHSTRPVLPTRLDAHPIAAVA
ncbi:MAG: hypothetical protein ACI8RZ_005471 [Myxococcota bacterium]|jgi:hypothetical protein